VKGGKFHSGLWGGSGVLLVGKHVRGMSQRFRVGNIYTREERGSPHSKGKTRASKNLPL